MDSATLENLWSQFAADRSNLELRNQLVEHYYIFMRKVACKQWLRMPGEIELEDIVSFACSGLIEAIERFEIHRNVRFETYAGARIFGSIVDELRKQDVISRNVRAKSFNFNAVRNQVEQAIGHQCADHELAAAIGIDEKELLSIIRCSNAKKINALMNQWGDDEELIETIIDHRESQPDAELEAMDQMKYLLKGLTRDERACVIGYYWEGLNMREIGKKWVSLNHGSRKCTLPSWHGLRSISRGDYLYSDSIEVKLFPGVFPPEVHDENSISDFGVMLPVHRSG